MAVSPVTLTYPTTLPSFFLLLAHTHMHSHAHPFLPTKNSVQLAMGEVSKTAELDQTLEKFKPLARLNRRLSRLDEIPWLAQATDIKGSLQTIKQACVCVCACVFVTSLV